LILTKSCSRGYKAQPPDGITRKKTVTEIKRLPCVALYWCRKEIFNPTNIARKLKILLFAKTTTRFYGAENKANKKNAMTKKSSKYFYVAHFVSALKLPRTIIYFAISLYFMTFSGNITTD